MSSTIPIADPEQLEVCPYDASHRVQSRRMVYHLERCRKVFVGQKKTCPFNGKHRVPAPELNYHMSNCPDKAMIDQDLQYSGMKQSGLIDDAPCGDLKIPDDDFNISSEECWESEIDENQSHFRLGRKRVDSSTIPNNSQKAEQLRLPSFTSAATTNAPVYQFSTRNLHGTGRGRGRGILPKQNGMSKAEISTFAQSNNVPFGRGFGLSKVAGAQQWQKSDSTTVSVNAVSTENTFTLGVGRGLKKKENIECNSSNKTAKAVTMEDLQKQSRRIEKKLRQIAKLNEMKAQGTVLDKYEEMKLAKKEILEKELEHITSNIKSWKLK
ncbi:unnamed protein product [Acanthosepion pharaonis]|uniref:CHHC U11-48K-type domain-containing protein n=1 Tax=Acanthosepion pharaonis TaxID=158019 RepID=A0A812B700_ACAPH|nr:unnamed protein product [Sepia pharaonis]